MPGFVKQKFFLVVGDVNELYPGKQADLPVTFVNGQDFDLVVASAKVDRHRKRAVQCDLPAAGGHRLPRPRGGAEALCGPPDRPVRTALSSAPDACQGATFAITVTSKATAA